MKTFKFVTHEVHLRTFTVQADTEHQARMMILRGQVQPTVDRPKDHEWWSCKVSTDGGTNWKTVYDPGYQAFRTEVSRKS